MLTAWWPTIYEAETTAFGGPAGIRPVHDLFCADSRGVLDDARRTTPGLLRREMSLLLVTALLHAAGLDWFERGDVFDLVARRRPLPANPGTARIDGRFGVMELPAGRGPRRSHDSALAAI